VAHLRHEVGLEFAQVGFPPQEDQHEDDAGDGHQDEADRERAEEQVEGAAQEHQDDAHQQDERRRYDDQEDEELNDAPIPEALPVLGHGHKIARLLECGAHRLERGLHPFVGQPELERQRPLAREHPEAIVAPQAAAPSGP
jgi:hypothetical protein